MNVVEALRGLVRNSRLRITLHARLEMDLDRITTDDLIMAINDQRCELIEDYPDDPRGASHLLLGWTPETAPIHICCAVHEQELVIITVYRPDPARWSADWRRRR